MFCQNCGQSLPDNAAFCGSCGTATKAPVAPAAANPMPVPAAPGTPVKSSPIVKILLLIVALFFLFGAVILGGVIYAGYKIKQKVATIVHEIKPEGGVSTARVTTLTDIL